MTITPQTNATLDEIAQVIRDHDDFVICGHVSPDGDCLGSQLALQHALAAMGKRCTCLLVRDEPIEDALSFLPGVEDMVPAEAYEGSCSVFIGVDVPTRERIGAAASLLDASVTSITLDHHAADTRMCEHAYIDPDSASASMIVWELVKLLLDEPPVECAECAYTGLVTDTGCFCFQNTDAAAFDSASELIAHGADPAAIAAKAFQARSLASLKLEALVIERLSLVAQDQAAISWAVKQDFDRLGATKADAEPLIDTIRELGGIRVACMLREQDGCVRGSLRSKDGTDIAQIARELGGGGHTTAAGFSLNMPIEQAIQLMTEKISNLLGK